MGVKCTESGTKQRDVTELAPRWPVITADQWTEPRDRGTERIPRYERRKLISQVWRPQRPQQLICWEKMKTLMFSLTSKHRAPGLLARHCWRYSVTAEGGNYSNAGLSTKPRGPALRNMTSHCGESQNGRPSETDLVKGD